MQTRLKPYTRPILVDVPLLTAVSHAPLRVGVAEDHSVSGRTFRPRTVICAPREHRLVRYWDDLSLLFANDVLNWL